MSLPNPGNKYPMPRRYWQDPTAPSPTRLVVGIVAMIQREERFLLELRSDIHEWGLVGGRVELDESLEDALRREVREELGIELEMIELAGIQSDPTTVTRQVDGTVTRAITVVCRAHLAADAIVTASAESLELRWFAREELTTLAITAEHRAILEMFLDSPSHLMLR